MVSFPVVFILLRLFTSKLPLSSSSSSLLSIMSTRNKRSITSSTLTERSSSSTKLTKTKKPKTSTSSNLEHTNDVNNDVLVDKSINPLLITGNYDKTQYQAIFNEAMKIRSTRGGWKLTDGFTHLVTVDPRFHELISRYGIPSLFKEPFDIAIDPFHALVKTITYQQLATSAANVIFERLNGALKGEATSTTRNLIPTDVLNAKIEITFVDGKKKIMVNGVASGLSESKSKYIVSLAEHFNDASKLMYLDCNNISDDDLSRRLVEVKGLGIWSVHMFMIFQLHRSNVLPIGDLGFRRGICSYFDISRKKVESGDNSEQIQELCKSWAPYSSLGSLYMWEIANEIMRKKK